MNEPMSEEEESDLFPSVEALAAKMEWHAPDVAAILRDPRHGGSLRAVWEHCDDALTLWLVLVALYGRNVLTMAVMSFAVLVLLKPQTLGGRLTHPDQAKLLETYEHGRATVEMPDVPALRRAMAGQLSAAGTESLGAVLSVRPSCAVARDLRADLPWEMLVRVAGAHRAAREKRGA